ncbi:HAD family acid phosphatase [Segnochrobactrum spirostomi]|uniref:Acid phosphatase n=1 Tax=Segnochrobactrum spirostomi TaxID=2608987 RepID=A0A6A7Y1F7_9HYPH|nr:HAD family acid phosphatase [Segnochrobactrum spirostomi]MQT12217.1 acid phosphatase [Segnochrobactrum spirostomi]
MASQGLKRAFVRGFSILCVAATLAGPALADTATLKAPALPAGTVTDGAQPENLSAAQAAAFAYYKSGAYERGLSDVAGKATAWIRSEARKTKHPALVLDIDETSLSNWAELSANQFAYFPDAPCRSLPKGPCGWAAWVARAEAKPIAPTLALFRTAKANGVAVFFITGRSEALRAETERNLKAAGYVGYTQLYMKPDLSTFRSAADFKAPVRGRIESAGYTIIANMGDQASDLAGGHSLRSFLLPDPFYFIP